MLQQRNLTFFFLWLSVSIAESPEARYSAPVGALNLRQHEAFDVDNELNDLLAPIPDASYTRNRKTSPPDSDCFPGTREDVIAGITGWADSPVLFSIRVPRVYWTHGYVGCGKSSISQAVSQKYGRKGRLLASFFFYRNSGDRSRMIKFAVTLASQMVAAIPSTGKFVKAAVKADPALLTREVSLATQLEQLVYKPLIAVLKRGLIFKTLFNGPFLVVIDGLDECEDKDDVREFIEHLLDFFKRYPLIPLRFFVTSRVEQHIKESLDVKDVRLDDLVAHGSDEDILIFLEASFLLRSQRDPVIAAYTQTHGQWPTRLDMETLAHHIGGSFIFASALFKYIVGYSDDGLTPMTRLPLTLNMNPGLDGLYTFTLARSQHLPHFSYLISTIALLFEPLPITGIAALLGLQTFEVLHILVNLQAIIHIPGTDELPLTFCHTSFRDFLTTERRSGAFFAPPSHHLHLAYRGFLLKDKQRPGSAVALYNNTYCAEHIEQFLLLNPDVPTPVPLIPLVFDVLFITILTKSRDTPHFSDIISTLALLHEPLAIATIAELLGVEPSDFSAVLVYLRAIVDEPGIYSEVPVILGCLQDFLISESRSGIFFVSDSYHLKLSYYCLNINLGSSPKHATVAQYSKRHCQRHWDDWLNSIPEQDIMTELEQLSRPPSHSPLPYHIFLFIQIFSWLFRDDFDFDPTPQQALEAHDKCIESLALALEYDPAPSIWLQMSFRQLGLCGFMKSGLALRGRLGPSSLLQSPLHPEFCPLLGNPWLEDWTPIMVYKVKFLTMIL
ncbi:hypothetical protein MD484_g6367, partial [Candolleomyces efflorescens]